MTSIRRRLLLSLLGGLLACTAIMTGIAYLDTTAELRELFTGNLQRMAVVIKDAAFAPAAADGASGATDSEELEESYIVQIWGSDGKLKHSSRPEITLPLQPEDGLSLDKTNEGAWEIYTLHNGSFGAVQVAEPQEIVTTMIGESALRALLPFFLLLLFLGLGAWYAVGRSLSPLRSLSQAIQSREASDIKPVEIIKAPEEIQPVVNAVNGLLQKLEDAMALQRQFTADASHELRTPLTAIRLQLDNLVSAPSEADRLDAVTRLSDGIDRCIHLAGQLLLASRSTALGTNFPFQIVRFDELVRSSMATFVVLASSKNIEIVFKSLKECRLRGDEAGLRVLINNLLDNAVRYTREGGHVTVSLLEEATQIVLEVSDDGVGIVENERKKIFRRFYRIPGTASTGSGLGLSIVKNVAEHHNATITISSGDNNQGTTMRVGFPTKNDD